MGRCVKVEDRLLSVHLLTSTNTLSEEKIHPSWSVLLHFD